MKHNLLLIFLIPLFSISQTQIVNNCNGETIVDNLDMSTGTYCIEIIANKGLVTNFLVTK